MAAADIANVEKALTLMRSYRRGIISAALDFGGETEGDRRVRTALRELPEVDAIIAALKSARGDEKVLDGGKSASSADA